MQSRLVIKTRGVVWQEVRKRGMAKMGFQREALIWGKGKWKIMVKEEIEKRIDMVTVAAKESEAMILAEHQIETEIIAENEVGVEIGMAPAVKLVRRVKRTEMIEKMEAVKTENQIESFETEIIVENEVGVYRGIALAKTEVAPVKEDESLNGGKKRCR